MKDSDIMAEILKVSEELAKNAPKQMIVPFGINSPMVFNGMPVYEVPEIIEPKIQVSKWFSDKWLTDKARDKINTKLVDMLGVRDKTAIKRGEFFMAYGSILARKEDVAILLNPSA